MSAPAAGVFPDPKPEPGRERNAWYCPACGTRLSYGVYCKTCKTERSFAYRPFAPGQEDAWLEELEALVKMTALDAVPPMNNAELYGRRDQR